MQDLLKKSLLLCIFVFFANFCYGLSNSEVRQEIQKFVDTMEFPQVVDDLTLMVDVKTTTRGILYKYEIKAAQDDLKNLFQLFDNIKSSSLDNLCKNPVMVWYKNNEVEMIYEYMDINKNFITVFKIHSSSC